jgi:hypothetical protein
MRKRKKADSSRNVKSPLLQIRPVSLIQGYTTLISGDGWPLDEITFRLGRSTYRPGRIFQGARWGESLVPNREGSFRIELSTENLKPGSYTLTAHCGAKRIVVKARLKVEERPQPGPDVPREKIDKPYLRAAAFKKARTAEKPGWPEGLIDTLRKNREKKPTGSKDQPDDPTARHAAPMAGACNWVPLGPAPYALTKNDNKKSSSGRIRSVAIDPLMPSRMYIGTAAGGVWKSTDSGKSWVPKTDDQFSLAIGALAIDPVNSNIVYAGTGEMVPGSDLAFYYGRGLLRSADYGETWTEVGATEFDLDEISRIVIDADSPSTLYVAATDGLWESTDSGNTWGSISTVPYCTDVVLVKDSPQPPRLIAGFKNEGILQFEQLAGTWNEIAKPAIPGTPAGTRRVVLGVCRTQPQVIYAAFCDSDQFLAHVARSDDGGQNWTAKAQPTSQNGRIEQAHYDLVIQPHPIDPDLVFLGVAHLFMSTDGGLSWSSSVAAHSTTQPTRLHDDFHVIVFHPTDPNKVFVGGDGGLFWSPDVGATWGAANLDISTIQLYDLGQHPDYEAIMIAGSQDNGGSHYSGAPIWRRHWVVEGSRNEMQGDTVIAQIDPHEPYFHYYGVPGQFWASSDAGRFFPTHTVVTAGTEWLVPFYLDPGAPGVVYTGGDHLQRSPDRGSSWTQISGVPLPNPIRSIASHASNPDRMYVGTVGGEVFRFSRPAGGTWDSNSVDDLDITLTGLPAGIGISSLAVDESGGVWATVSDVFRAEATGEFTNHHVYRLGPDAQSWETKSDGLEQANPINTIVIDPKDSSRLYCGGDRGVFSWDAPTQQWRAMDQGLPNAPVFKLMIHEASRKIRAATYGRGVWERSLDGAGCSDHFLYFRDNLVDSGATPSPDNVPHPYIRGDSCRHWHSEDIIVDSTMQTPSIVKTPTELYDNVLHEGTQRGPNRVYVTVHNKGPFAVTNVDVRAYLVEASAGLSNFPPGLLADPFSWVPSGTSTPWHLVGGTLRIGRIEPGTTRLVAWEYIIPSTANSHSCVMAFATSAEDPLNNAGITNPNQLVLHNRKVTLKNLTLQPMPSSGSGSGGSDDSDAPTGSTDPHEISLYCKNPRDPTCSSEIVPGPLPRDAVVVVAFDRESTPRPILLEPRLSRNAQRVRETFRSFRGHSKELNRYDLENIIVRDARVGQKISLGAARTSGKGPIRVVVWIHSKRWNPKEVYSLHLVQTEGKQTQGGYTIQIAKTDK